MKRITFGFLILCLGLAACTTSEPPPAEPVQVVEGPANEVADSSAAASTPAASTPAAPRPATAVPSPLPPTAVPLAEPPTAAAAEPAAAEPLVVSGRTAEGAFFLGSDTAPITLIDYSDFL